MSHSRISFLHASHDVMYTDCRAQTLLLLLLIIIIVIIIVFPTDWAGSGQTRLSRAELSRDAKESTYGICLCRKRKTVQGFMSVSFQTFFKTRFSGIPRRRQRRILFEVSSHFFRIFIIDSRGHCPFSREERRGEKRRRFIKKTIDALKEEKEDGRARRRHSLFFFFYISHSIDCSSLSTGGIPRHRPETPAH